MTSALLITVDSLRADHVGCYGYERETTPTLDALAEDSVAFDSAFAHACHTKASFPALLTSTYPLMYGGYDSLAGDRPRLADAFDDAGFRTAGLHSNLYLSAEFGYDHGFDEFFDSKEDPGLVARARRYVKSNLDEDGVLFNVLQAAYDTTEKTAGIEVGSYHVTADDLTDRAISFVESSDPDEDQFLWVHYMDVHHPYIPPADHQRAFRDDVVSDEDAIKLRRKMLEEPEAVTDEELDTLVDLYDAEIRFTDTEIGRLLDTVSDEWGDDVVTAVTADHGEEFLDHGDFAHRSDRFYDELLHVPLLVSGVGESGRRDELTGLVDVGPTLVDYADATPQEGFVGRSLRGVVDGTDEGREYVFADDDRPGQEQAYAVRTADWKYIRRPPETELFDLDADPGERENVVESESAVAERLSDALDGHVADIEATRRDVERVEMEESTKERLRNLGYKE